MTYLEHLKQSAGYIIMAVSFILGILSFVMIFVELMTGDIGLAFLAMVVCIVNAATCSWLEEKSSKQ